MGTNVMLAGGFWAEVVSGALGERVQCLNSEVLLRCARAEAGTDVQELELAASALWAVGRWGNVLLSPEPQQLLSCMSSVRVHCLCSLTSSLEERQTLSPPEAPTAILATVKIFRLPFTLKHGSMNMQPLQMKSDLFPQ